MYELIKKLFETYEYESQNIGDNILFSSSPGSNKKDFWLVVQENNLDSLIENQIELREQCRQANHDRELEKNISMLVLWNTEGNQEFSEMKKKIMPIEEDPYFFKKHVLYFSETELTEFHETVGQADIFDFVNEKISLESTFRAFKDNPQNQTWQSLLYRLSIKLPFIKININEAGNVTSLYIENNNKIRQQTDNILEGLDRKIFELYGEISDTDLREKEILELLSDLAPALSVENENGD